MGRRGAVAQPPRVAAAAVLVVVVLVAVRAPFAVRKVGATKLGHVLGEEDVLWGESIGGKLSLRNQDSTPPSAKIRFPHL